MFTCSIGYLKGTSLFGWVPQVPQVPHFEVPDNKFLIKKKKILIKNKTFFFVYNFLFTTFCLHIFELFAFFRLFALFGFFALFALFRLFALFALFFCLHIFCLHISCLHIPWVGAVHGYLPTMVVPLGLRVPLTDKTALLTTTNGISDQT